VKSIQVVQSHKLSNGDTVKVTKSGRKYNYIRLFYTDQPPYIEQGLRLDSACSLLIAAMENDICETE